MSRISQMQIQGENRDYALKGHGLHLALGIALGFSVHVIFAL